MQPEQLSYTATQTGLSGAPVFVGTWVPVQSPFDYLAGGDTRPSNGRPG